MSDSIRCPGMRDVMPPEMERFRRVEQAFRDVCLGWGYGEVRTPTIEHLHLFTSAGTLSPQMLGRVYSFLDWDGWSGERVVLRPDSTIPAVRLYAEQMAGTPAARLFYVQNVLRFAQGDDSREDWQCGAELIGHTFPQGDVELVLMATEVLQRLGLEFELKLSDPGILRAVFSAAGLDLVRQTGLYDRVLDGDVGALAELQEHLSDTNVSVAAVLGVDGDGVNYIRNLRAALGPVAPGVVRPLDELAVVSGVLAGAGVSHSISPALVRNFEYYTGPVFHLYSGGAKVGGGGRYDSLVALAGGPETPASGFALEAAVLSGLLSDQDDGARPTIVVRAAGRDVQDLAAVFSLARALRDAGQPVEIAPEGSPPGSREVIASGHGFVMTGAGETERRLAGVDDVLLAVTGPSS